MRKHADAHADARTDAGADGRGCACGRTQKHMRTDAEAHADARTDVDMKKKAVYGVQRPN